MTIVPRLIIRDDDGSERVAELPHGVVRIGRSADNEIVLGDADKGVSRAHAELHLQNGRYVIVDLQSQNGTWLNGLRVQRAEVRPDTEIGIGTYRLTLQFAQAAPASADRAGAGSVADSPPPFSAIRPATRPGTGSRPPSLSVVPMSRGAAMRQPQANIGTTKLDEPVPEPAPARPPKPSAWRMPLLVGGIAAVALIGIVIGRFVVPATKAPAAPA